MKIQEMILVKPWIFIVQCTQRELFSECAQIQPEAILKIHLAKAIRILPPPLFFVESEKIQEK